MSSTIGERVRVTLFGQSHGEAVGVVVDGLPAGEAVDLDMLQVFLNRRAPGGRFGASGRQEPDRPKVLSGLLDGKTCGAPLCAVIDNADARPADYRALAGLPRPGHADYPAHARFGGHADLRGGGHFSARLTAPLCVAGGIALQLLARRGITVGAHIAAIDGIEDAPTQPVRPSPEAILAPGGKAFPVMDDAAGARMQARMAQAAGDGDSVGGVVACTAIGLPAGLGSPVFGGVENRLSAMLFGIPAVRGIAFGAGFEAARMTGAAHNDAYIVCEGEVATATNHHGGVLGGMTTGMPLRVSVAFKPTPSIAREQDTVRLADLQPQRLAVRGRHDACVVPRAVPCVEAAVALVLLDLLCEGATAYET